MGAKSFEPKAKAVKVNGPYVCCQCHGCPGLHGRASYQYVDNIEADDGLVCSACSAPWSMSMQCAIEAGQVPGLSNVPKGSSSANSGGKPQTRPKTKVTFEPAAPAAPSPFTDAGQQQAKAPFGPSSAGSCFRDKVPQVALDAVDDCFHVFLHRVLLEGGVRGDQIVEHFQAKADADDKQAKAFLRAVALGKPAVVSAPFAPGCATAPSPLPPDATIDQQCHAAYQEKQASSAKVQQCEKAVADIHRKQDKAKQRLADVKELVAAAEAEVQQLQDEAQASMGKLVEAQEHETLASQKLQGWRVRREQQEPKPTPAKNATAAGGGATCSPNRFCSPGDFRR
jgi:hypothetical protein